MECWNARTFNKLSSTRGHIHLRCHFGSIFHVSLRLPPLRPSSLPIIRSMMLSAYKTSAALLAELREAIGEEHHSEVTTQSTEVTHLKSIFRSSPPCREDFTALLQHLNREGKNAFSSEQRQDLIDVARNRVSTTVAGDGEFAPMLSDMPGSQKTQTHVHTYRYYNADDWVFFR